MVKCLDCDKNAVSKGRCKNCYGKKYRNDNKEKIKAYNKIAYPKYYNKNKKKLIKQTGKYKKEHPIQSRFYNMQRNAQKRGIQFNLNKNDFIAFVKKSNYVCEYCGIKTKLNGNKNDRELYSIDRMDNNKGYQIDNIVICCNLCNTIKHAIFTYDDMKNVIGKIIRQRR